MWPIFAKIYSWWLGVLLVLGLLIYGLVHTVNQHRFENFVQRQAEPALTLIREGLERHNTDQQSTWLDITASLTGVAWQLVPGPDSELQVEQHSWKEERAVLTAPMGGEKILQGMIRDWEQLATGVGLMVLNELSLTPVSQREHRLDELQRRLGLNIARVGWQNEDLGFVDNRNLALGQVVVRPDYANSRFLVYVPAGAEQALKIGPFSHFEWLTGSGIMALAVALLLVLAVALVLVLWPLQRRLSHITQAVDRIREHGKTEDVLDQPTDALGTMWRHVNSMAQQLIDMADQSRQLNQAVSHDLKTPLARMAFALEMLGSDSDPLIKTLKSDVRELNQLLDELLTYHQLSQSEPAAASYCFPREELDELLNSGLTQHSEVSPQLSQLPRAAIEAQHWRRLCRNLISNAVQYGHGWVEVSLTQDQNLLKLSVADDGPGFSDALKARALEPFVRGDKARNLNAQGHGMGLALCHSIVSHYRGRIEIGRSRLGGAQIDVVLPILALNDPGALSLKRQAAL